MQNNLNNPVFNPNDYTTWRWKKDNVLQNIPIRETEANQIRQIAPHLGGIARLLETKDALNLLEENSPEHNPKLIERRAAIIINSQFNNKLCIRNQDPNAHDQLTTFFEDFSENIPFGTLPRMHKIIDSNFATKEFLKGRKTLDTYNYYSGNLFPPHEITECHLFRFFNCVIENTQNNDQNYINIRHIPVDREGAGADVGNYIYEAFNYLRETYDYAEENNQQEGARRLLNRLIGSEEGINSIIFAIRVGLLSQGLSIILKYFSLPQRENQINWDPLKIARFINFLCEMGTAPNGLNIDTMNEQLLTQNFIEALTRAFDVRLSPLSLSYALQVSNTIPEENELKVNDVDKKIAYMLFAIALIEAPESPSIDADCINALLSIQRGVLALNLCRHFSLEAHILAQALNHVTNIQNNPTFTPEHKAAYLELIANTVKEWTEIWLRPGEYFFNRRRLINILWYTGWDVFRIVIQYVQDYLGEDEAKLSFNKARVSGLNAKSLAYFMRTHRDYSLDNPTLSANINFTIEIIQANNPDVNANLINELIYERSGATFTLHTARDQGLNASSVAHLMQVGENHTERLSNLKLTFGLMNETFHLPSNIHYRPTSEHLNAYLNRAKNPELFNVYRLQGSKLAVAAAIHYAI